MIGDKRDSEYSWRNREKSLWLTFSDDVATVETSEPNGLDVRVIGERILPGGKGVRQMRSHLFWALSSQDTAQHLAFLMYVLGADHAQLDECSRRLVL